jgi:hypothetical protein
VTDAGGESDLESLISPVTHIDVAHTLAVQVHQALRDAAFDGLEQMLSSPTTGRPWSADMAVHICRR